VYSVPAAGGALAQLTFAASGSRAPRPAPDGRTLLVERAGGLWLLRADGTQPRRLAVAGHSAAWSRDGRKVAYVGPAARPGIHVYELRTRRARRVTSHPRDAQPSWSPDGRALLFVRDGAVIVRRGGKARRIAVGATDAAWSPDGRWIAYTRRVRDESRTLWGLTLVRPDGTGRRELVPPSSESGIWGWAAERAVAAWAPDSRSLALADERVTAVVDVRTGTVRRLSWGSGRDWAARAHGRARNDDERPAEMVAGRVAHLLLRSASLREPSLHYVMNGDGTCEQPAPPDQDRFNSPWRPGAWLPGRPIDCVDLGYLRPVQGDERGGLGLPLSYRLRIDNDGTRAATQALLVVEPESGRAAAVSVPGTCSGGARLVCRLALPPRAVTELVLSVTPRRLGRVITRVTLTSPEQEHRQVQVASLSSEVVRPGERRPRRHRGPGPDLRPRGTRPHRGPGGRRLARRRSGERDTILGGVLFEVWSDQPARPTAWLDVSQLDGTARRRLTPRVTGRWERSAAWSPHGSGSPSFVAPEPPTRCPSSRRQW
jgi:hypothetical protein